MQTASPMARTVRCESTGRREPAGHVEAIAPLRRGVRRVRVLTVALTLLLMAAPASAHDTKEYTMLLKEDGVTPDGVPSGVLVSTDSLFFYNVDSREEAVHRVLIDADGDGEFKGVDDMATAWLSPSCELDENDSKVNPDCEVTELVLLDPSNGLLPGSISMLHQIDHNQSLTESAFAVSFSEDQHTVSGNLPTGSEEEQLGDNDLLVLVLMASLVGIVVILPRLMDSTKDE